MVRHGHGHVFVGIDVSSFYHFTIEFYNGFDSVVFFVFHFIRYIYVRNPSGTPGYRNGTEIFFGFKGRPSVVRDV